jgi:hypothetical protein
MRSATQGSSDWGPNSAFPHNVHQNQVTDADITSEREMCDPIFEGQGSGLHPEDRP